MDTQKDIKNIDVMKLGTDILRFTNQLNDVVDIIWKSEKYVNQPDRFIYTLFLKIKYILESIHFQIQNLDHKPHYAITAGLALRTCMLDVLSLYYVLDALEDDKKVINRINALMADHLKYVYAELKNNEKDEIRKDWHGLFEENGSLKKFKTLNATDLYKGIIRFDALKREAEDAKHIYSIFSKYEHNGAFTFDLLHNPFYPKSSKKIKFTIKCAVNTCVIALRTICDNWVDKDDPLAAELNTLTKECLA